MRSHLLRWALCCVAATTLAFPAAAGSQKTVTIGPGDSIDSLARKYHVAIKDIARVNHISPEAVLIDGDKLVIPKAPKVVVRESTMRNKAFVNGDRVTVRIGPNESYRRLTLLDHGAQLLATARAGDWTQVKVPSGKIGWVKSDFLKLGAGVEQEVRTAGARREARGSSSKRVARKHDVDEDSSAARRRRQRQIARRHHLERVARAERGHQHHRIASGRLHGRPEASAPKASSDVIRTALAYRGTPYHFGGSSRRGFDCSGFTSYVYGRKGVNLPHSAADQFNEGRRIDSGHLKQGDLVFFHTTRSGISHVGIYAGNGKFVHASSSGGRVRVDSLSSGYYRERFRGARRVR